MVYKDVQVQPERLVLLDSKDPKEPLGHLEQLVKKVLLASKDLQVLSVRLGYRVV
jgi:hypothetical protein